MALASLAMLSLLGTSALAHKAIDDEADIDTAGAQTTT